MDTKELWVNSLHHQAIKVPANNASISGRAEDGVAELLEVVDQRFVVGIQGHPEEIYTSEPACARLFSAFVKACGACGASFSVKKLPVANSLKVGA